MIRNGTLLLDLHPRLALGALICGCKVKQPYTLGSGYRPLEEQAAIYAQGRTAPGPIATNAPPGKSAHNWRAGLDGDPDGRKAADYQAWGECMERLPLLNIYWGGNKEHPIVVDGKPDIRHVELKDWRGPILVTNWRRVYMALLALGVLGTVVALTRGK